MLSTVTGLNSEVIPLLLFAYGAGGFVGNVVAGRLTDHSLGITLTGVFLTLAAVLTAFPLLAGHKAWMVGLVLTLGCLSTAAIAPLQVLVLRHAGSAPSLSLAVNVGAFNLANAMGAALGGVGVAAGWLQWTGFGGAIFAILGLILATVALRNRRPTATP